MRAFVAALAVALTTAGGAVVSPAIGSAASCSTSWKHAANGDWAVAANWTHGVPTTSSTACITVAGTYTVSVAGWDSVADSLSLGARSGTQTMDLMATCDKAAYLTLTTNSVVGAHGVVNMSPADECASGVVLSQEVGTFTNNGLIHALPTPTGINQIHVSLLNNGDLQLDAGGGDNGENWTNNGTIEVADDVEFYFGGEPYELVNNGKISSTGNGDILVDQATYAQALGTTSGKRPIVVQDGTVNYTGAGKSTVYAMGRPTTVTGNIAARQTLVIEPTCDSGYAVVDASADWTNRGKIVLTQTCDGQAQLGGEVTLTNLGTIQTSGGVTLDENVVNEGTVTIGAKSSVETFGAQITNTATGTLSLGVAAKRKFGRLLDAVLNLGGTLAIDTTPAYWPHAKTVFPIATFGSATGSFASVTGATRSGETVAYTVVPTSGGFNLSAS